MSPACISGGFLSYESQNETQAKKGDRAHLTLVPNSKPESTTQKSLMKSGYGGECKCTKFGTYAKRTLLRVGGAIDKFDSTPENGVFLTGTLPGSTHAAKKAIADWSGYIVHRLKAWIAKYVPEKMDFYVWERQKRGALHLHYYLYVPDPVVRRRLIDGFKAQWIRLLEAVSSKSGVDLFRKTETYTHRGKPESIQAYAQEVKKSVAAYLAKYCSKDASKSTNERTSSYYPSRWWGASRPLLALLRSYTREVEICFSSYAKARSKYEEIASSLEQFSIKGYRYGDRVGFGLNHVFYYSSEDLVSCFKQAERLSGMGLQVSDSSSNELLAELSRMLVRLKELDKIWLHYWGNFTKESKEVVLAFELSQEVDLMKAYSLAVDLHLISVRALDLNYGAVHIYSRVRSRAEYISASLDALISGNAEPLHMGAKSRSA